MGTHVDRPFAEVIPSLVGALQSEHERVVNHSVAACLRDRLDDAPDTEAAWRVGSVYLYELGAPFCVHATWYALLSDHIAPRLLPAWQPDADALHHSNLARFIESRGFASYSELHAWSVAAPDQYWQTTLKELGVRFETPPVQMRAAPEDVEQPRWLDGARLNVARACLEGEENRVALIVQQRGVPLAVTKRELRERVNGVALGLRRLGVLAGDPVAIAVPLGLEAVVAYLALLHLGAVVVCIAESYSAQELRVRLEITAAKWVVVADVVERAGKRLPLYQKFLDIDAPCAVVVRCASSGPEVPDAGGEPLTLRAGDVEWNFQALLASTPFARPVDGEGSSVFDAPFETPVDAPNTVLFSSGTTGTPKAIPWTPSCAIKAAADARWHLDVRPGDRLLWPTSLGWMMGAWSIFATLLNDATLVIYDDAPTVRGFGELVQSAQVTHVGVVPSLVRHWRQTRVMEGLDWSHVRLFSSTGECSNPVDMLYLMWLARYRPIVEYCGGTEIAGGYITGTLLAPCVPSCFTTAALGQNFVCLDDAGNAVEEGEAFLTLPSIGLSTTLLNRDHHAEYFAGVPRVGVRRHGDLIQHVSEIYYRVLGRADDTMNLGGIKVSSAEIERACEGLPGVREVAAIAVSPPSGGPSHLVLWVVPNEGSAAGERAAPVDVDVLLYEAQRRIRERVNPLFRVQNVVVVDSLPRTASNKVIRRLLRSRYAEPNPKVPPTDEQILATAVERHNS